MSVIIPTRNSASTLDKCLTSIDCQTYHDFEVLVIDNYSTDATAHIAKRHEVAFLQFGPERSSQVNFGVQESHGKYIYRVDSDMLVSPDVISQAVATCEGFSLDGVIIRSVSDAGISYWSKVRSYERSNLYDFDRNVAVRFISKRAFSEIGGFDQELSGFEDYDLHDRFVQAGFKYGRIAAGELHIGEPRAMAEIVRKHFYYGKFLATYLRKDNGNIGRVTPLREGQLTMLMRMKSEPSVIVGFALYQYIRYFSALVGMLSAQWLSL